MDLTYTQTSKDDERVVRMIERVRAHNQTLVSVESCTGGLVGKSITDLAGISDVYLGGYITYSNEQKSIAVGVDPNTLESHGAVSSQVAIEMAQGGCQSSGAKLGISTTGIAGPTGGSDHKPIGTVWICVCAQSERFDCRKFVFPGDRSQVREHARASAIEMMIQLLEDQEIELHYQHEQITQSS